jgi:hypothetical protein
MPCPHSGAKFTTLRVLDRPLEFAELMINMYLITPMPRAISEVASWPSSPRQAMSPAWPIKPHAHNPSGQFAPAYREWPSQWQIQFLNISNTLLPRSVRSILTEASTRHGDQKGICKWPKQISVSVNFKRDIDRPTDTQIDTDTGWFQHIGRNVAHHPEVKLVSSWSENYFMTMREWGRPWASINVTPVTLISLRHCETSLHRRPAEKFHQPLTPMWLRIEGPLPSDNGHGISPSTQHIQFRVSK